MSLIKIYIDHCSFNTKIGLKKTIMKMFTHNIKIIVIKRNVSIRR